MNTLLLVVRIKAMCKRAGVGRLDGGPKGATRAVPRRPVRVARRGWWSSCNDQQGQARIKDNKLVVLRDWASDKARLVGAFGIARDLAALARPREAAARSA